MTNDTRIRNQVKTTTKEVTLRLPVEMADVLKTYAFISDESVNEIVKRAVAKYLSTEGREKAVTAAFEKALIDHAVALDKLRDL